MANPEQLALLQQGITAWNEWRQSNPDKVPDLTWANLGGANLGGANLSWVYLSEADLGGADLRKADLRKAGLRKANLSGANLGGANLSGANLTSTNLSKADLGGANLGGAYLCFTDLSGADLRKADLRKAGFTVVDLSEANLSEANLDGAVLCETIFINVNLTEVKGLDTCRHEGRPSLLDFRTLQQSGPLPLAFLRGCGLPDPLIDYLPSLLNQPTQYYSCFISYSSNDKDFAQRLYADLQNKGVHCWFAPEDMRRGRKLYEQIIDAIRLHEKLLLVLSEHSINSEWVKTEIAEARQREKRENRQVLFPISLVDFETIQQWKCFDADIGKDSAKEIREYFIADFSNWKSHNAYQQAFDHLLRDLKPALERKPETS